VLTNAFRFPFTKGGSELGFPYISKLEIKLNFFIATFFFF